MHTPPYASRVDTAFPFSYGFSGFLRDISEVSPRAIVVNFWTYFPRTGINANLVVSVDSAAKIKSWTGWSLLDSVKTASQWQQIRCKFALPGNMKPDDKISVYIWCPDRKEIFVDDLAVKFLY